METVYDKTPSFQIPDFLSQETRHSNPIAPQQEMAPVSSHKIPIDALDDDTEDEDFMAVIKKAKLTAAKR